MVTGSLMTMLSGPGINNGGTMLTIERCREICKDIIEKVKDADGRAWVQLEENVTLFIVKGAYGQPPTWDAFAAYHHDENLCQHEAISILKDYKPEER